MAEFAYQERNRPPELSVLMLAIETPGEGAALQFRALIRNLAAGVATLEVKNPWTILNWETLKGRGASLRLPSESGEVTELRGKLTWLRYTVTEQDSGQLSLGLKLTESTPAARKQLSEYITHSSEDIKSLWNRWEEARQAPEVEVVSTRKALIAATLLAIGLNLQLWPKPYRLLGWGFWLGGTLMVAAQTLQFWKSRKAMH